MRVLLLHNRYQISGGEDSCVNEEAAALGKAGVIVHKVEVSNDHIRGLAQQAITAVNTAYSFTSRTLVSRAISAFQPDVVHVHNFFPVLSPSVYDASPRVPFIQTLHNYRTICPAAVLFRNGNTCEECLGKTVPWPAVKYACYRGSRAGSLSVAASLAVHSLRNTWKSRVSRFIALTEFARDIFLQHLNLRREQIVVKPNASSDTGMGDGEGGYALYVGRLSSEKGIATLLKAAELGFGVPVKVVGEGAMSGQVADAASRGLLEYLGKLPRTGITALMKHARVLLLPSLWYEGLPMVIPEAYATGLPIIASNLGALPSLILDRQTGLLVQPGDACALAEAVRRIVSCEAWEATLRANSRATYEALYRPEQNLQHLLTIYKAAIRDKSEVPSNAYRTSDEN